MRFIHTADFHLKMNPEKDYEWSKDRKREIYGTFEKIVLGAAEQGAELLLIAGDLFHEQPRIRDLREADSVFGRIPAVHVVIIAGNHDYIRPGSAYNDFTWSPNVTFLASDRPESVYFEDINTEVYGFSYHDRMVREDRTEGLKPANPSRINILMVHGGTAEDVPFDTKALENSGFDYVALGHIHKAGEIGRNVRYCGSPEPLDRNETGEHGYILGEIDDKEHGNLQVSFVKAAQRQYFHESITVNPDMTQYLLKERIAGLIEEKGTGNYYCIELTGRRAPETVFETEDLPRNVLSVTDNTVPNYDFDRLQAENSDNVIGMFIASVRNSGEDAQVVEKALYYGLEALRET